MTKESPYCACSDKNDSERKKQRDKLGRSGCVMGHFRDALLTEQRFHNNLRLGWLRRNTIIANKNQYSAFTAPALSRVIVIET